MLRKFVVQLLMKVLDSLSVSVPNQPQSQPQPPLDPLNSEKGKISRPISQIILHCSDSETGDSNIIKQWHLARGFNDIGYHYVIKTDGVVELGRDLNIAGAHCQGHNRNSVGICLVGRSKFTVGQLVSLKQLIQCLRNELGELEVHGHREYNDQKTCPGFTMEDWKYLTD